MMKNAVSAQPSDSPATRILEVADRLFYEQGYAATGINELIKEAGVAKASFYHHFGSKMDLVVAYLNQRQQRSFEDLVEVVERRSDPVQRVLALFDFLEDWLVSCDFRGCAFLNTIPEFADPSSEPRARVRAAKQGAREYIGKLCADAGHADAGDEVFLLFEGATAQAAALSDLWPVEAARAVVSRRFSSAT